MPVEWQKRHIDSKTIISNDNVSGNEKRTKCEVYSRVVGYLRPTSQWNKGKQQEFKERKVYKIKEGD
jgi:anaerobic ribonucleoside-triphosphate reductase